jgi:hypothetical protein
MIRAGQHTGLASQVARGEVSVVFIFAGGNDFIHGLASEERSSAADHILDRAIRNLDLAVNTILKARPTVQVFIATVPDITELPEFLAAVRAGRLSSKLVSAFSDAISRYNWHIRHLAMVQQRIALVDLALATQLAPRPDSDHVVLFGRRLDRVHPANSEDRMFLADSRHISTLVQGLLANYVINALNARLDARIKPLTVSEILGQKPDISAVASVSSKSRSSRFPSLLGPWSKELLGLGLGLRPGPLYIWAKTAEAMGYRTADSRSSTTARDSS